MFSCVDSPQFNGVAFKLDAHTHFAARVRSADIEETPLNSSHRRRRTKAKEEVTRGSRKLKLITPPLKGKGLHTLLFLMRPFPHGVLDTSAESISNFETKNKVLTHFLAMLTQFSARFRCETWIRGRNILPLAFLSNLVYLNYSPIITGDDNTNDSFQLIHLPITRDHI